MVPLDEITVPAPPPDPADALILTEIGATLDQRERPSSSYASATAFRCARSPASSASTPHHPSLLGPDRRRAAIGYGTESGHALTGTRRDGVISRSEVSLNRTQKPGGNRWQPPGRGHRWWSQRSQHRLSSGRNRGEGRGADRARASRLRRQRQIGRAGAHALHQSL